MAPQQVKIDEFAYILLGALILITVLMVVWTTPLEPLPLVKPESILLEIQSGAIGKAILQIQGPATEVRLSSEGEIKDWVTFSRNFFNVVEEARVEVSFSVPEQKPSGIYLGKIIVTSLGGNVSIPVEIHVKPRVAMVEAARSRSLSLGSLLLEYGEFKEILKTSREFEVFRGVFAGQEATLEGEIPEEKLELVKEFKIRLKVEDANQVASLVVLFNQEKVFDRVVGVGEYEVEVPLELVKASNLVVVSASPPPFWRFWQTNFYRIEEASLEVVYEGVYSRSVEFELSPLEVKNFVALQLSFRRVDEVAGQTLLLKLNNQLIYYDIPPLLFFNKIFDADFWGNPLSVEEKNVLTFELEKAGRMDIRDLMLKIFYA